MRYQVGRVCEGKIEARLRWPRQCLLLLFLLQGCAIPETRVTHITVEPGASLADYHVFEVEKVTNDTGKTFSFDVSSFFADELESALRKKGYEIAEQGKAPAKALRVTCSIVAYSPSTAGQKAEATGLSFLPGGFYFSPENTAVVKATLLDQQTGKVMALITAFVQGLPYEKNAARNAVLASTIRDAKFGYTPDRKSVV